MFTIIVTGSRYYHVGFKIKDVLQAQWRAHEGDIFIKMGDCPTGVDNHVLDWCNAMWDTEDHYKVFNADWTKHGKKAGPIRNHEMADSGADLCIAWPLEDSKGTRDCASYAYDKNIPVWFPDLPLWAQWAAPINQWRS